MVLDWRLATLAATTLLVYQLPLSSAEWEFEVGIYRFSNPFNHDNDGGCCEISCSNPCDHYFAFCLRVKDYEGDESRCPRGAIHTFPQKLSVTTQTFTPGDGAKFLPGVPNPLLFRGNKWASGGFQLYIVILDEDTDADDLIDEITINRDLAPRETFTTVKRYSGQHGAVDMDFSFRVRCSQDFFGSECIIFCEGRDDSTGHYVCDANGDKICLDGWTDVNNNCLTPVCAPNCSPEGGSCDKPGDCNCKRGWNGTLCDECLPAEGCVHGTCVVPGDCNCNEGYNGTLCNIDQDVCGHQSPCANGGTCTNTGDDSYHCDCAPGFTGVDCDTEIDECASSPCNNGGTCIDEIDGFTCNCSVGWEGPTCDNNTDECLSSPCQNGGTCIDCVPTLPDSPNNDCELGYTCNCSTGFYGDNCEGDIDYCLSSPCQNNATCHDMETTYRCECAPGYTGRDCETEIDECASNPCKNGGTCHDGKGDYSCSCPPGYTGKDCDIDIDDCIDNKCVPENTVECVDEVNSYKCKCHPGYTGRFCETEIDECDSSPCENGATCRDLLNDFICDCPEGFTGPLCSENIDDCHPDLCLNGSTCVDEVNNYTCSCVPGYTGRHCEDELPAPCKSNPCGPDMFCIDLPPLEFCCEPCAPGDEGCAIPKPQGSRNLGVIIGSVLGAAFAIFLLMLLLVLFFFCCKRCFRRGKVRTVEGYGTISREGATVSSNPMYFAPSDIETSRKHNGTMERDEPTHPLTQVEDAPVVSPSSHSSPPIIKSGKYDRLKTSDEDSPEASGEATRRLGRASTKRKPVKSSQAEVYVPLLSAMDNIELENPTQKN